MSSDRNNTIPESIFGALRNQWVKLPQSWRHKFWSSAGERWQSAYARQMIARPAKLRSKSPSAPLVVAGLFSSANGIGEAARATYRALHTAGLNPVAVDLSLQFAPVDLTSSIPCREMPEDAEGTLILQLNGPETMSAMQHLGMGRDRNWYTIGYWAWELPSFPPAWDQAFQYLSEIWTISEFSANALRLHPELNSVQVFPHAIAPPHSLTAARGKWGIKSDQLAFLTMADSMSSLQRKNPFAAIRAFRQSFGNDESKLLIVKIRNLDETSIAKSNLERAIEGANNIRIMDVSLTDRDRWSLLMSADAVISLHRSEGFGLVLAEAMALGKPVITTDWSGNMDFTRNQSAALVRSTLVQCKDDYGIYGGDDTHWAEADIEHAVSQLNRIACDRSYRTNIGEAAKRQIQSELSSLAVGTQMKQRLDQLINPLF